MKRDHPNKHRTNEAMCDIRFAQSVMESIASFDRSLLFDQLYEECSNIKCREEDILHDSDAVLVEKEEAIRNKGEIGVICYLDAVIILLVSCFSSNLLGAQCM